MEEKESYIRGNVQVHFYARAKASDIENILDGYRHVHAFDESSIESERKSREVARLYLVEVPKEKVAGYVRKLKRDYPSHIKDATRVSLRLYSTKLR